VSAKLNRYKGQFQIKAHEWISWLADLILSPYRIFKLLCFYTGLVVILSTVGLGVFLHGIYRSVPNGQQMSFHPLREVAQQVVRRKLEDQSRFKSYRWTEIHDVSRDYLYTIVMSEDSSFFEHEGIDVDAIMNSVAENLRKKKYEYGASTITQQVVKNLFLTNEKSIIRKLKELLITERIEKRLTKNQILELYLNLAEFGPDLFGVREASQHFFRKSPSDINAAEGAFIALMLPSPRKNYYSIYQNQNLAKTKKRKIRRVLGDMLANEFISQKQYQNYIKYNYYPHPRVGRVLSSEE
jgi:monofunctional biosynthetic peptidoglycan transglycosylase